MSLSSPESGTELSTYRSFRRFPQLHASMREISVLLRNSAPNTLQKSSSSKGKLTTNLKRFSKSVLPEIHHLRDFKSEVLTPHFRKSLPRTRNTIPIQVQESSSDPISSAKLKLAKFSMSYYPRDEFQLLNGFSDKYMSRDYFKTQLRSCLRLSLTSAEEDALFEFFGPRSNDTVDGIHFIRLLSKLKDDERKRIRNDIQLKTFLQRTKQKSLRDLENDKYSCLIIVSCCNTCTFPESYSLSFSRSPLIILLKIRRVC